MNPWPLIRQRRWLLLSGLALALLAAYWLGPGWFAAAPAPPPAVAPGAAPAPPIEAVPGSAGQAPVAAAASVGVAAGPVDIFAVRTWEPPPPPVDTTAPPPPPPPPEAPPLPFRYLGKVEESGRAPVFFLARDDRILAVHPGQVIDRDYRVGRYAGGQLAFLYRPMKIEQFLPVGDKP